MLLTNSIDQFWSFFGLWPTTTQHKVFSVTYCDIFGSKDLMLDYVRKTDKPYFVVLSMWAYGVWTQTTAKKDIPGKNGAQGLDNPWRSCAWELDNSRLNIFALELDNSNWELDVFL